MIYKVRRFLIPVLAIALLAGCASGRAYRRGQDAARLGDWDTAVAYYRQALMEDPDRLDVRVALERATQSASLEHLSRARKLEAEGQFAAAAGEYRRVVDLDPSNQLAAAKTSEMDKLLRDQIDAARPKPQIDQLREQIRKEQEAAALPLNQPLPRMTFAGATLREVLEFIATSSNVNIIIDPAMPPEVLTRPIVLDLQGNTVDQVLGYLSTLYKLFYRTLDARTILVAFDNVASRSQYEEQLVQTFYVSHTKASEVGNTLTNMLKSTQGPASSSTPTIVANDANNTVTVRASASIMQIVERLVRAGDRPKAEVVIEVSILEVDRARVKQHGLDLSQYAVGVTVSPELAPPNTASTPDAFPGQPPPFRLNTISRGISSNDAYLTVPTAMIRFLESDANTRLIAKPNLRGQADKKLTLNLGDEIPIPTTTFGSAAGGGLATVPISQFEYRPVGINMEITPHVTYDGEIVLEMLVESSGQGPAISVAGQALPSFTSRKVSTTMRLRDGESNMIAGLLREDERRSLRGFPGLLRLPILRELFTSNDRRIETSDIVMLLTPRIVRTQEITADDLRPINVGTNQNTVIGGGGPVFGGLTITGQTPAATRTGIPGAPAPGVPTQPVAAAPGAPPGPPIPPANSVTRPVQDIPPPAGVGPPANPPVPAEPAAGLAQIAITAAPMTPGTVTSVPISITAASRVTQLTLSVAYDPKLVRPRTVVQGGFMAQGGNAVTFIPQIDEASGRITIVISRAGDAGGASGTGLLASIQFEPLAAGDSSLAISGVATSPEGQTLPLVFVPAPIRIR